MRKVTKAVIPAAGLGSRMYPFTKEIPKLFIPVLNKPIVAYLIEELAASGIKEVIIVSDHLGMVKNFFTKDEPLNRLLRKLKRKKTIQRLHHIESMAKIDLIRQKEPRGWMHEVWHARDYLKGGPFVVCFSDVLYKCKKPAARQVIDKYYKIRKNIRGDARFVFKPSVLKLLDRRKYPLGDVSVDDDIMKELLEKDDLHKIDIQGEFYDVGDPVSHLKTETAFGLDEFGKEYRDFIKNLVK